MLEREWLNLILDVDFMTLNILKLDFFVMFLVFIIKFRATLQNFVEKHQFNVILSYSNY